MEPEIVPDPSNDKAMAELHKFVEEWTKRHGLEGAKELYYLALYMAGRQNVQVKLENLKKLYAEDERDEIGYPLHPKPFNVAERCEELIAQYEEMYCKCNHPGTDSVTAKNGTCADCGKPVRIYDESPDPNGGHFGFGFNP